MADSVKRPDYFEGVLQLRNVDEDILDLVLKEFQKEGVNIAKISPLKNGYDLYSSSNKFSRKIARKLATQMGGEIKESPRIFTQNKLTSKEVHRLNVLYRAPDFAKGEVIANEGKVYQITSMEKMVITVRNLSNGKREKIKESNTLFKLPIHRAKVINTKPRIQVLDPESFQAIFVENPGDQKEGEEINIVISDDKVYVV